MLEAHENGTLGLRIAKKSKLQEPARVTERAGVGHDRCMPDPSNPFAVLEALLPPGHRPEPAPRAPRGERPSGPPRPRAPRPPAEPEGPPAPPLKLHEALRPGKAGFDALRYASWHGKASPLVVAYLELLAERFPSAHDQSFIKRAADRGELARGLMRRLAKLAKQHGLEAPELAEELGRAARSLAFWPGFPEAAKRLLMKVTTGEEDPIEGVGRFDRIEPTWSQRKGRTGGPEGEEGGEARAEGAAPAKAKKAPVAAAAEAPTVVRPFLLAPFVRRKPGEHRVWNQAPSESWVMHAAEAPEGWVGILVPRPVSRELPEAPEAFQLATAEPAQLAELLQQLAEGELGVLGVAKPGADGLEALIAWVLRLLPVEGETKLEVIAAVGPEGPSVKAAGQGALRGLARADAGRAKSIRLAAHPGKGQASHHAQALATLCFDAHPEAMALLGAHPWLGACMVGAPWPTRGAYDALNTERLPGQDALTHFLAAASRVTAGSLEALVSELMVERLRTDAKLRRSTAEGAARSLRLGDDLLAVGRVAALLGAADPEMVLPPALQLGALLARLESGEGEAAEAAAHLAQALVPEDARLACAADIIRAELCLAAQEHDAAEAILQAWLAKAPELPGLGQWLALQRTMALLIAARGDKAGAKALLAETQTRAEQLMDPLSRNALLATLAMADDAIDPKPKPVPPPKPVVSAESLALMVESESLLVAGERVLADAVHNLSELGQAAESTPAEAVEAPPSEEVASLSLMVEGESLLVAGESLLADTNQHLAELNASTESAPEAESSDEVAALSLMVEGEGLLVAGEALLTEAAEVLMATEVKAEGDSPSEA